MGLGSQPLQLRQRPQEAVEAPVGLQLARHETHHLVPRPEGEARLRQADLGTRAGRDPIGVDALMDHAHPLPEGRRHGGGLPGGGGQAPVEIVKGQQLGRAPEPQPRPLPPSGNGELGIEARVGSLQLIHELHLMQHRHIRNDVLHRQQFPPAGMADHQIRFQTFPLQGLQQRGHRLGAQTFRLQVGRPGMTGRHATGRQGVIPMQGNAWQGPGGGAADGCHRVPRAPAGQGPDGGTGRESSDGCRRCSWPSMA